MKKTSEIIWEMKASMMLAACFIKWWLLFPAKTVIVDVSEEFLLFAALSSQTVFSLLPLSNTLDFGSLHVPFDFYDPCVTIKIKWGSLFNLITVAGTSRVPTAWLSRPRTNGKCCFPSLKAWLCGIHDIFVNIQNSCSDSSSPVSF